MNLCVVCAGVDGAGFYQFIGAGFVIPGTARGSVSNSSVSAVRVTAWDNVAGELACPNLEVSKLVEEKCHRAHSPCV